MAISKQQLDHELGDSSYNFAAAMEKLFDVELGYLSYLRNQKKYWIGVGAAATCGPTVVNVNRKREDNRRGGMPFMGIPGRVPRKVPRKVPVRQPVTVPSFVPALAGALGRIRVPEMPRVRMPEMPRVRIPEMPNLIPDLGGVLAGLPSLEDISSKVRGGADSILDGLRSIEPEGWNMPDLGLADAFSGAKDFVGTQAGRLGDWTMNTALPGINAGISNAWDWTKEGTINNFNWLKEGTVDNFNRLSDWTQTTAMPALGQAWDSTQGLREGLSLNPFGEHGKRNWSMIIGALSVFGGGILGSEYGYDKGGIVSNPTRALIGEGGESEVILPMSKIGDAMEAVYREGGSVMVGAALAFLGGLPNSPGKSKVMSDAKKLSGLLGATPFDIPAAGDVAHLQIDDVSSETETNNSSESSTSSESNTDSTEKSTLNSSSITSKERSKINRLSTSSGNSKTSTVGKPSGFSAGLFPPEMGSMMTQVETIAHTMKPQMESMGKNLSSQIDKDDPLGSMMGMMSTMSGGKAEMPAEITNMMPMISNIMTSAKSGDTKSIISNVMNDSGIDVSSKISEITSGTGLESIFNSISPSTTSNIKASTVNRSLNDIPVEISNKLSSGISTIPIQIPVPVHIPVQVQTEVAAKIERLPMIFDQFSKGVGVAL